jgi:hypothetical protein
MVGKTLKAIKCCLSWSYKENLRLQKYQVDANLRLVPITVLYFNKRCEVGEKHLAVYYARLLSKRNLTYNRRGN